MFEGASIILFKVKPWNINNGIEQCSMKRKRWKVGALFSKTNRWELSKVLLQTIQGGGVENLFSPCLFTNI